MHIRSISSVPSIPETLPPLSPAPAVLTAPPETPVPVQHTDSLQFIELDDPRSQSIDLDNPRPQSIDLDDPRSQSIELGESPYTRRTTLPFHSPMPASSQHIQNTPESSILSSIPSSRLPTPTEPVVCISITYIKYMLTLTL